MDADALEREIEKLHDASYGWALACCGFRRDEADDVLQTAYLKVLDGRARHDGRSSVKTWLFAVIRNTAADSRRRGWMGILGLGRMVAATPAAESAPAPDRAAQDRQRRDRLRGGLAALPQRQREVLDLVFFHDLTVEEAARVMGVSVGSARVHYDRGKRGLAGRLGPTAGDLP